MRRSTIRVVSRAFVALMLAAFTVTSIITSHPIFIRAQSADHALVLDTADYASAPMLTTGGISFTIECWANPSQANESGYLFRFVDSSKLSYGLFMHDGTSNAAGPYVTIAMGTNPSVTGNGLRLPPNTWTHVAMTRNGAEWKLYKNGELVGHGAGLPTIAADSTILGGGFHGRMMEFRIWNVARSQDSIRAAMPRRMTAGDSTLIIRYTMTHSATGDSASLGNLVTRYSNQFNARMHAHTAFHVIDSSETPLHDALPPNVRVDAFPQHMQFFGRGTDQLAHIAVNAHTLATDGIDSLVLVTFRDDEPYWSQSVRSTTLSASVPIKAELAQYTIRLLAYRRGIAWLVREAADLVAGDAYLVIGQSNSHPSNVAVKTQSPYLRTLGVQTSNSNFNPYDPADTLWGLANGHGFGQTLSGPYLAGVWGIRLQDRLMNDYHIPVCVINGGAGASTIEQNLRIDSMPTTLTSVYGKTLYRSLKSGMANQFRAIFWFQGESNTLQNYYRNFKTLYHSWTQDYPNVKKFYVYQVRPSWCGAGQTSSLRNLQRTLDDSLPNIRVMSTSSLPGHDGCHYSWQGYYAVADAIYPWLTHDFYGGTDTINALPPQPIDARFASTGNTEILIAFKGGSSGMHIIGDTLKTESLRNYLYLDSANCPITGVAFIKDTLHVYLGNRSEATAISYLPDQYFNDQKKTYEGPTMVNGRGIGAFTFYHLPILPAKALSYETYPPSPVVEFKSWPSPFVDKMSIKFSLETSEHVGLKLYNALGSEIADLYSADTEAGIHTIVFNPHSYGLDRLASGAYFLELTTPTQHKMLPLRVAH